jgi:sugar phosphate isomerase/epimerase
LEGIASCGIANVELASIPHYCDHLPPGELPGFKSVLKSCDAFGLRPVAVSAHGDLREQSDVTHIEQCMRLASEIGAAIVNTGTGDTATAQEEQRVMRSLAELAAVGEEVGVTLGVETQNSLFTSGERAVAIIDEVGSERIRINLDAANIKYWNGNDPLAEVEVMAKYVAHMHVKDHRGGRGDYEFPPLGAGDVKFEEIISRLLDSRFEGVLVLEPEPSRPIEGRPAAEVERVRARPGLAYSEFHAYLGEHDAEKIDAEIDVARQYLSAALARVDKRRRPHS